MKVRINQQQLSCCGGEVRMVFDPLLKVFKKTWVCGSNLTGSKGNYVIREFVQFSRILHNILNEKVVIYNSEVWVVNLRLF